VLCIIYFFVMQQKWQSVQSSKSGRDYATYHYALQTTLDGENPYVTENLNRRARLERTRRKVHPFFYPPPSILSMIWARPFLLNSGYQWFFWFNQIFIVATFVLIYRWLRLSFVFLVLLAVTFTPLADTVKMGQANIFILFLLTVALVKSSGLALGIASMTKMSPALLVFQWAVQKRWVLVLRCVLIAVLVSIVVLPFIGLENQIYFYQKVLPGFSSGQYHGLNIPINIPANHSIPDLYNQIWPGETQKSLSVTAKHFSFVTNMLLLLSLLWLSFKWRAKQVRCYLEGAMICMMIVFPVYCYEHHLALLILPFVIAFQGLREFNASSRMYCLATATYFFAAWPLFVLRFFQKQIPSLHWVLQESKFFSIICTALICIWCAYKANQRAERTRAKTS
jgi:hypothetical protein